MSERRCRVLIAGAGPAGLASALFLLQRRPELAGQIVLLERARHPRPKVCAGGLIPKTLLALDQLGLDLAVPAVEVKRGAVRTGVGDVEYPGGEVLCTVIRRAEFDAWLADRARAAGAEIVEDCRVGELRQDERGVRVATSLGEYRGEVLIGADGSGSRVREHVSGPGREQIGRALMYDLPVERATVEFREQRYRFDFRCVEAGVKGYSWSFPCLIDGRPHLNVGIYDQAPHRAVRPGTVKARLLPQLWAAFPEIFETVTQEQRRRYQAYPIRWYSPSVRFVSGRVLLAGDAAGCDPLMGEGISCAFEQGKLAAAATADYLAGVSDAFARYDQELHHGAIARKLRRLYRAANWFYGPHHRWFFRLARLNRKAQVLAVDWYNGARDIDELSLRQLLRRLGSAVLLGTPLR